jgi:hypothetical protein
VLSGIRLSRNFGDQHTDFWQSTAVGRSLQFPQAGENPSPLERLLAERIALYWLQIQYFEIVYAQTLHKLIIIQRWAVLRL